MNYFSLLSASLTVVAFATQPSSAAVFPTVDLGYGVSQATINQTSQYYNFGNIRYAQPPVGNLRFAAPQPPLVNRTIIFDGQHGRICPQGFPNWSEERSLFIDAYLKGMGNLSSFINIPPPGINATPIPPQQNDGRANEDCLFLDVLVPTSVYKNRSVNSTCGAPVLVWIFGGGDYEGSKDSQGDAAGLIAQSISDPNSSPGVVYVALNYRLGALGWLAGPSFSADTGTPNAALYDQRLALQWVQENIHLFRGDSNRVTIMGASAGAACGMHQITAFGGADAPFQQVFLQSPAFSPNPVFPNNHRRKQVIWNGTYGSTGFGPTVDGIFVPELPSLLFAQGHRATNVRAVFSGHNTDEGLIFADPAIQNTSAFDAYLTATVLPNAQPEIRDYVANTLYPPIFDNATALGYNDTISRLATLLADLTLTCNVIALLQAFDANLSHAYLFEEGASLHAEETPYMFYNYGPTEDAYGFGLVNDTVAQTLQDWVLNFGATGQPNGPCSPYIPTYGPNRTMGLFSNSGLGTPVLDPAGKERCDFWQKALYF